MNTVTPLRDAYALSASEPESAMPAPQQGVTIACIDDDEPIRQSMALFLRAFSYNVETFPSAEAFLAERRPGERYCLILDLNMPQMSGLDLQRRLSEMGERHPIIFVTAFNEAGARKTALEGGALGFLAKPPNHDELLRLIDIAVREAARGA